MESGFQIPSFPTAAGIFFAAAIAIAFGDWRLSNLANNRLADRTGMGEAITDSLFLGAMTSKPGNITSVTAAWHGYAELAVSNAIGGSFNVCLLYLRHANYFRKQRKTFTELAPSAREAGIGTGSPWLGKRRASPFSLAHAWLLRFLLSASSVRGRMWQSSYRWPWSPWCFSAASWSCPCLFC